VRRAMKRENRGRAAALAGIVSGLTEGMEAQRKPRDAANAADCRVRVRMEEKDMQ
jgi:hypothetical protein